MNTLFDQTEMKHLKLKNRLFRSATWDNLVNPDGTLTKGVYKIYEELAKGGVGTIITALCDVGKYNQALPGNMRLYEDFLIEDYKRLTDIVHQYNCNIILQLNMDDYAYLEENTKQVISKDVNDINEKDIEGIIKLFVNASIRAKKAGFDGVQIHLAYSWLLNRFINPNYNYRTDHYGGSTKNRARLIVEIIREIKRVLPDFHVTTKISFYLNEDGSFATDDCIKICKDLAETGIDSIEVCGQKSPVGVKPENEGCFINLAKMVQSEVDVPVILVGGNHQISNMEKIINETNIQYLSLSRPLIREPDLPNRWLNGDRTPALCISCDQCHKTHGRRCIFNLKGK